MTRPDAGFTLIEALVAMAVLAVAAAGFVRATESHIDTIARLEARAAGGWVAENRLAETRIPGLGASATGSAGTVTMSMLGHDWRATVAAQPSDDSDIAAVTVTAENSGARAALRGFRDLVPPPPPTTTTGITGGGVPAAVTGIAR